MLLTQITTAESTESLQKNRLLHTKQNKKTPRNQMDMNFSPGQASSRYLLKLQLKNNKIKQAQRHTAMPEEQTNNVNSFMQQQQRELETIINICLIN